MQKLAATGLMLVGMTILAGCATSEQPPEFGWEGSVALATSGSRTDSTMPLQSQATELSISADAGPEDYVRIALERNPGIAAAERRVEGLKARIPQVTSLDDPMLQVAPVGEMAETAAGQVGVMSSISQKFPFFGKLDTRGRIAQQDVAMAMQDLEQTKLSVIADTRRAYWSYYFAAQAIRVTGQTRELLRQFQQIADARFPREPPASRMCFEPAPN